MRNDIFTLGARYLHFDYPNTYARVKSIVRKDDSTLQLCVSFHNSSTHEIVIWDMWVDVDGDSIWSWSFYGES